MRSTDVAELSGLAALWGAAFLLMRIGAGDFGPVALAAIRVSGASLLLLPLLRWRGQTAALRAHWRPIFVVGLANSALPFLCFSYAALSISAGLSAIFNAASPLFGALIARFWLGDRLTPWRSAGLAVGFAGVLWVARDGASFHAGGTGWAVVACVVATVCYGWSACYAKKRLGGVPPLAIAAGSQLSATLFLLIPAIVWWPERTPGATAWLAAAILALACTGLAYVLYFRLIAHVGPANAIAVTFLIPAFAVAWGWLFLDEGVSLRMMGGCAVIVLGTALATGLLKPPRRRPLPAG